MNTSHQNKPQAVFLDSKTLGEDIDLSPLYAMVDLTLYNNTDSQADTIISRIGSAQVVITNKVKLSNQVIQQCQNLKLVLAAATGTDHIDLQAASKSNILVCNARNYATASVAQHTLAMILNLATNIHNYHQEIYNGHWSNQDLFCLLNHPIIDVSELTLGIIGYGALGKAVAERAQALGMIINICESLTHTSARVNTQDYIQTQPARTSFDELLKNSDIVSLHCPLTGDNHHLINEAALQNMKNSAFLINTARGGLVDSQALCTALDSGEISGAALDVFAEEPLPKNHCFLEQRRNNLLLTPHTAWASHSARQSLVSELMSNLEAWHNGSNRNLVNSSI